MPDLRNRSAYEQQVERAINSVFRPYRNGEKPYRPAEFEYELEQALTRELTDVHREAMIVLLLLWMQTDSVPLEAVKKFDTFPRQYAKATASSVRQTTTDRLRRAEGQAQAVMRKATDYPKLEASDQARQVRDAENRAEEIVKKAREGSFGRPRAEGVAVTSVTTTASRAESASGQILAGVGTVVKAFWVTEKDSKVCPICRPLHNEPEENWRREYPDGPAAHVNCRCFLRWEIV